MHMQPMSLMCQSLWHIKHHAWRAVVGIIIFKYLHFRTVNSIHNSHLLTALANVCLWLEQMHLQKIQTPALFIFFFFTSKHEIQWQTWNIFNSGINLLLIFYGRNCVHFIFWGKKMGQKMYLEYFNIGVHINAHRITGFGLTSEGALW